jgi:anti-sigma regulatory factor (Ser/Thr protein kinase)
MSASASRAPQQRREAGVRPQAMGEVSTVFPSVAPSAASARRFVSGALRRWACPNELMERVTLLTSELVTNAYRHANSATRVSIRCADDRVHVEVRDSGGGGVELRPLDTNRTDGRGLHIVDTFADRWGHHSDRDGNVVWFELVARW